MSHSSAATLLVIGALAQIQAGQGANLSGVIADPNQAVIPGARVTLSGQKATGKLETRADASGRFQFSGVAPGTYTLSVSGPGFEEKLIKAVLLVEGAEVALPMILMKIKNLYPQGCGGNVFALPDIRLESLASGATEVAGRVWEPSETSGVNGVRIILSAPLTRKVVSSALTDNQGIFRISNVKSGTYSLRAHRNGFADFIINRVRVLPAKRSSIQPLELHRCPIDIHCRATKRIRLPVVCL